MHMKLNLIAAAVRDSYGIGKDGQLPWKLKKEMDYFTSMTTKVKSNDINKSNVVIMGRKTWDSIPLKYRPLPKRINIIITKKGMAEEPKDKNVIVSNSIEEGLNSLNSELYRDKVGDIWVIGGSSVYQDALKSPQCYRIYLTEIFNHFDCDVFFPKIPTCFKEVHCEGVPDEVQEENGIKYKFKVFERVN